MEIKQGHYLKGCEPIGCYNTGVAAVIANSKQAKKYTGKAFIVGRDIDVLFNMTDVILDQMRGKKGKAKFFATKKAAVKAFEKLNDAMIASNQKQYQEIQELKKKAGAGDMAAVLALGDY